MPFQTHKPSIRSTRLLGALHQFQSFCHRRVAVANFTSNDVHILTNDGAAFITFLPLTDTYDPAFLQFHFAVPTPTITSPPGLLVWADLTTYFGNITPFQTIVMTTVFTATAQVGIAGN